MWIYKLTFRSNVSPPFLTSKTSVYNKGSDSNRLALFLPRVSSSTMNMEVKRSSETSVFNKECYKPPTTFTSSSIPSTLNTEKRSSETSVCNKEYVGNRLTLFLARDISSNLNTEAKRSSETSVYNKESVSNRLTLFPARAMSSTLKLEATRSSETSVYNIPHGAASQKSVCQLDVTLDTRFLHSTLPERLRFPVVLI
jgi:hypothetical protein